MPATQFCFASSPSLCFEFGSKRAAAILPHLPPADGRPFGRASRQRGNRQVSPTTGAPASGASLPCLFESLRGLRAPEFKPRWHHASRSAMHDKCLTPASTCPLHHNHATCLPPVFGFLGPISLSLQAVPNGRANPPHSWRARGIPFRPGIPSAYSSPPTMVYGGGIYV